MNSISIILSKNLGYKWHQANGIYVKGYFLCDESLFKNEEAIELFISIDTYDKFRSLIQKLNGIFSVILEHDNEVWAAVDICRSIPLFYDKSGTCISDNAECIRNYLNIDNTAVDDLYLAELLLCGYNMFSNTVYKDIKQIDLGQIIRIKDSQVYAEYYYRHIKPSIELTHDEALEKLEQISGSVFRRLIKVANGRQIVLALSGGLDSRFIAAMLRENEYKNVICYTCGSADKFEIQFAKTIARRLNYPWFCIEFTDEKAATFASEEIVDYIDLCHNHSTTAHMQDYVAIKELHNMGVVHDNAVFVTGYCGDLPAGSFVLNQSAEEKVLYNNDFVADLFVENEYFNYEASEKILTYFKKNVCNFINELDIQNDNFSSFTKIHEALFTGARPSKMITNANRVYEYFGHEWLMPLWDKEYLDFWYMTDVEFRKGQSLYREFLLKHLFKKYDITMIKVFQQEMPWYWKRRSYKSIIKYNIGALIVRVCFLLGIPLRREVDWLNHCIPNLLYYKKIKNKDLINYKRANINTLQKLWDSERLYSEDTVRRVLQLIKEK